MIRTRSELLIYLKKDFKRNGYLYSFWEGKALAIRCLRSGKCVDSRISYPIEEM